MKRILLISLAATLLLPACTLEDMPGSGLYQIPGENADEQVWTLVPSEAAVSETTATTRSDCLSEAEASAGKNFYLAVYTAGRLVGCGQSPFQVTLLGSNRYNFYAWTAASLGRTTAPALESDLTAWEATYTGLGSVSGSGAAALESFIDNYGMPMAGRRIGYLPSELSDGSGRIVIPVERLFAKVRLSIDYDATMTQLLPGRSISAVTIHNWAYACHPFSREFDRSKVHAASLDVSSSAESDGTYILYLPENLQGEREGGGDTQRCSYISVQAHFNDNYGYGGGVGDALYRFFPHSGDGERYDIERNRAYNVRLSLSYDGRFISGEWKEDGDTQEQRSIHFDPDWSERLTAPGKRAYMTLSYQYGSSANLIHEYYNRFNGVAVGTSSEIAAWTASGTLPQSTGIESVSALRCKGCGQIYWGYPSTQSARLTWADEVFDLSGGARYCPQCNTCLIPNNALAILRFQRAQPNATDNYLLNGPAWRIYYDIPSGLSNGSVIRLQAATRDGRIAMPFSFTVGDNTELLFNQALSGTQYIAEKIVCTPVSLPSGIESLTYTVTSGSSSVISEAVSGDPLSRSFSFIREGSVTIEVRDQNNTLRQQLTRTVLRPVIRLMPAEGSSTQSTSSYALEVSGEEIRPRWAYARQDGTLYTSYDPDLYASRLGDVTFSVDGRWTGCSDGKIYINRTEHSSYGTLPYQSSSIGTLTARCPAIYSITISANLTAVNPFSGWPDPLLSYQVHFAKDEAPKKDSSILVYYNSIFQLLGRVGTPRPLSGRSISGNPPFGYSSQEAMSGASTIIPTIDNKPSDTYYYGKIKNKHSQTYLTRDYLHIVVTVDS